MLKKLLAVALSFLMLFGAIGCDSSASSTPDLSSPSISTPISSPDSSNSSDSGESPDESESSSPLTPTDPELPDVNAPATAPTNDLRNLKNILIIGNSHAEDTFLGLPAVFKAEGYEDYTFGFARRGSHTITMHRENIEKSLAKPTKPVLYGYQKCTPEDNGIYSSKEGFSFEAFLKDVRWDIVYIQTGVVELTEDDMCKADRDYVVSYIKSTCTNPDVKIAYSNSWTAPYADDQATRDKIYANYSKDTDSFWPDIIDKYEFNKPIKQHNKVTRLFEKNIFTDSTYYSTINTGTAVLYAHKTLGRPANAKTDTSKPYLYRDSMHMSDYGRVLVAYSFFAQYTGTTVTNINLKVLPAISRGAYDPDKNPNLADLVLATEWSSWNNWEKYLIEAVEYSRTNPWTIWSNEEA